MVQSVWKPDCYSLRCPSADECMDNLYYLGTTRYYITLKRNELSSHQQTFRKLKCIILNENKIIWENYITLRYSRKDKNLMTVKYSMVARLWGEGRMNSWSTEGLRFHCWNNGGHMSLHLHQTEYTTPSYLWGIL